MVHVWGSEHNLWEWVLFHEWVPGIESGSSGLASTPLVAEPSPRSQDVKFLGAVGACTFKSKGLMIAFYVCACACANAFGCARVWTPEIQALG